ncbi:MAG: hypothetical protein IPM22_04125 [Betaproteobacteria bacterium]|nr:hypothetical protein [Betaproteobacteria bacterium]
MADTDVPELPGSDLRWRVAGHPDDVWFWKSGGVSIANIGTMLSIAGKSFTDYSRAPGSAAAAAACCSPRGCRRKVRLRRGHRRAGAIAWAQAHIPWSQVRGQRRPAAARVPGRALRPRLQPERVHARTSSTGDAWLAELPPHRQARRRPRAFSVSGEHPFSWLLQAHRGRRPIRVRCWRRTGPGGIVFVED